MAPPQWAYQVENFVNEPDEELVCSICRSVFCDPVMCPCDHVFCRDCVMKWLMSNRNCPICRKRVSSASIKQMVPIVKNIIMKLVLNCVNKARGCTAQFSVESSEAHERECEYEYVRCKNKPCENYYFRKDMPQHETVDCPHRCIRCQKCRSKMPTSGPTEKHDCIQTLRARLRRKCLILRKKNVVIEALQEEIKAHIDGLRGSQQPVSSTSGNYSIGESFFEPDGDDIMLEFEDFGSRSSSFSSDSDDSSEESIIFMESPSDHSDAEAGSFLSSVVDTSNDRESRQNESVVNLDAPDSANRYSHVGSQTDLVLNDDLVIRHQRPSCSTSTALESNGQSAEASNVLNESEERSSTRPGKRRPSVLKPAKRRFPPVLSSSSDDDFMEHTPGQPLKGSWLSAYDKSQIENRSSEAGPSSVSRRDVIANASTKLPFPAFVRDPDLLSSPMFQLSQRLKLAKPVPSGSAVFEKTLELMNQHNLDSDPEWLPEMASHRGDTPSPSGSDSSSLDESSGSELGASDNSSGNHGTSDVFK